MYTQRALVARLSPVGIGWYYAKRLSRVLLLTWASMTLSIALKESNRFNFETNPGRIVSCFLLATNLYAPGAPVPAPTVSRLVNGHDAHGWLLFPASQWLKYLQSSIPRAARPRRSLRWPSPLG